jgi:hypothetical protein
MRMLCTEKSVGAEICTIRVSDALVRNPIEAPVIMKEFYNLTRRFHANAVTVPTKSDATNECSSHHNATHNFSTILHSKYRIGVVKYSYFLFGRCRLKIWTRTINFHGITQALQANAGTVHTSNHHNHFQRQGLELFFNYQHTVRQDIKTGTGSKDNPYPANVQKRVSL